MAKPFLLTIDVEDWFQVENLRSFFPPETWPSQELRVEKRVFFLLDLLDRCSLKATFFVLGWLAKRLPGLVREIAAQGHEIASHGYGHVLCSDLNRRELLEDLHRSRSVLEDISGQPVLGYRAPSFSVSERLTDLLAISGYKYDSSFNSLKFNARYGKLDLSGLHRNGLVYVLKNGLLEIPLSNLHFGPFNLPMAGGGYFRFWPAPVFHWGVQRILAKEAGYVFYCHPWEFDPDQPRVRGISPLSSFRHYLGLKDSLARLEKFLASLAGKVKFSTCVAHAQERGIL